MAVRAYMTPFSYDSVNEYLVELEDTDFVGTSFELEALTSLPMNFDGDSKNRFKVINGTQFDIDVVLDHDNATHMALFTDLALQQEGRFFLKVSKYEKDAGTGVFDIIFVGNLTIDETYLENKAYPTLTLSADDGLNRLKSQEFKSDTLISNAYGDSVYYYEGEEDIMSMIFKCLSGVGTQDLYLLSYFFLRVNFNWYESQMNNVNINPLENIRINHRIFTRRDEEGNYFTSTKAEVLEYLLNWCNCRISYKWGSYYIDKLNEIGVDSRRYFSYKKDGSYLGANAESTWITTIGVDNVQVLAGGKFGFLPPIKEACVTFNYDTENYGYTPTLWTNTETTLVSLGDIKLGLDTSIFGTFFVKFTYEEDEGLPTRWYTFWFGITLKVTISGTDWYYVTDQTIITVNDFDLSGNPITYDTYYYAPYWTTTPGLLLFKTRDYINEHSIEQTQNWTFTTEKLVDTAGINENDIGELFVKLEFVKGTQPLYDNIDKFDGSVAGNTITWRTYQAFFSPTESGEEGLIAKDKIGAKYCVNYSDNNSTLIDINTKVGDVAFNSNNRLTIFDGFDWNPSTELWGVDTLAGTQTTQELLLNEIIAGQPYTIRRYIGGFAQVDDPRHIIKYDGVSWVAHKVTYDLFSRRLTGEFLQFIDDPQVVTVDNKPIRAETSGTLTTASSSTDVATDQGAVTTQLFPFEFIGPISELDFDTKSIQLPDITVFGVLAIDVLVVMRRNGVPMEYDTEGMNGYTIDAINNTIILNRSLRSDERIRGHVKATTT